MFKKTRTTISAAAMALVLVAAYNTLGVASARAQSSFLQFGFVEGSWSLSVNVQTPPGIPGFPDLMTFIPGGGLITTRPGYIPVSPAGALLEGTGHGAWVRTGPNTFTVTAINMLQGAPGNNILNGAFFAFENLKIHLTLGPDGNTFTAPWTSTFTDANGNVVLQTGGTLTATRIQAAP